MIETKERPIIFSGPMVRAILEGQKTMTRRVVDERRLKVFLPRSVHSDVPSFFTNRPPLRAKRGIHKAWMNPHGAVFVRLPNGKDLGVKPDEFEWVSPYGKPGDRLWVRETWADVHPLQADGRYSQEGRAGIPGPPPVAYRTIYRADGDHVPSLYHTQHNAGYPYRTINPAMASPYLPDPVERIGWVPSTQMPRWASRILLEIVSVRVERLQEIGEEEAQAEGLTHVGYSALLGVPLYSENPSADPDKHYTDQSETYDDARMCFSNLWDSINAKRGHGWDTNPWVWVVEFRRIEAPNG